jgi:2-dehydro-3-deoxyphosphogluconate aldolase/(4S)-4-hydroxy-2-oxoglutarate aldolase
VDDRALALRASASAAAIREQRLVAILRRIAPPDAVLRLVDELVEAGARAIEITLDGDAALSDLAAVSRRVPEGSVVGAGTIRGVDQVRAAIDHGAQFGVAPILDLEVLAAAIEQGLPFMPAAYSPTEIALAWRSGATFVKLFPASSLGPRHVRELRGPLPEIELIATGGVDGTNAAAFLEAGAVAVGIGSALVRATPEKRRALIEAARA